MPATKSFQIECHQAFDFRSADYAALYAKSDATVFQHPLWLETIYEKLAPALKANPVIVTVRERETGQLLMLLPMVRTKYASLNCIEPVDFGVCDYNSPIVDPAFVDQLREDGALHKAIMAMTKPVDLVFIRKLRQTVEGIECGFGCGQSGLMNNNFYDVALTTPYADWREHTLSAKLRKAMRRTERKLSEFGEASFAVLTEQADILDAMATMRMQRADRYPDDLFQQQPFFDFYCQIATQGAAAGLAETSVLRVGDNIAAVEFGLLHRNCYHFILCGIDNDTFAKHSPGMLMKDYVLAHRVEVGDSRADFTIGDEAYKGRFGASPMPLHYFARAENLKGSLALAAYTHGGFVKSLAKKAAAITRRKAA